MDSLLHTPNVSSGMETGISILLAVIGLYGRSRTMYGSLKQIGRTSLSATINSRCHNRLESQWETEGQVAFMPAYAVQNSEG